MPRSHATTVIYSPDSPSVGKGSHVTYTSPKLYSVNELAELLSTEANAVKRMHKMGVLPTPVFLPGGKRPHWLHEDIVAFVNVLALERQAIFMNEAKDEADARTGPLPEALLPFQSEIVTEWDGPGVYFLMNGSDVVYVGVSVCVNRRIHAHMVGTHSTAKKDFARFVCIPTPVEELFQKERIFIRIFDPPLNKQHRSKDANEARWNSHRTSLTLNQAVLDCP